MFRILRASLLTLLVLATACTKNEFTLDFELEGNISENYNVTYYATAKDGGITVQAVASVMQGKCLLKGVTQLPTLVYITAKRSVYPLVIYAEKGNTIKITGETNRPTDWDVDGNEVNLALSRWRIDNMDDIMGNKPEKVNADIADFIEKDPTADIAPLILLAYFDRNLNESQYSSLMSAIRNAPAKEKWIMLSSRADQLTTSLAYPARIETLVMRSAAGGTDTLRFDGKRPGLILFWQNEVKNKKAITDSLYAISKEFSDTSSRIIADINLDADSTLWANSIKRDSIKNIVRLWSPAGLADRAAMKLKVGGLPYYIVVNNEGIQTYRGDDLKEAIEEFRGLQPAKKSDAKRP